MENNNNGVEVAREITLYNVRGGNLTKIQSFAKTWGELKSEVRKAGFDVDKSLITESVNKTDLVSDLAVLPTGAFRLYLRPKEVKSGLDRKQLFAEIKEFVAVHPDKKQLFVIGGCNMTQLSTPKLQELYDTHIGGSGKTSTATAKAKADKVEAKSTPKEEPKAEHKKDKKEKKELKKLKKAKGNPEAEHHSSTPSTPATSHIPAPSSNGSKKGKEPVEYAKMALSALQSIPGSKEQEEAVLAVEILIDFLSGVVPEETEEEACAREAREIFGK